MDGSGRHTKQRALDHTLPNDRISIVQSGITFRLFPCSACSDETTGKDEIHLLVDERSYAWLEQPARLCQITVDENAYAVSAEKMNPYGFKLSPDAFYATIMPPDSGLMGKPPEIRRTLH
jgi:hypothetical protein